MRSKAASSQSGIKSVDARVVGPDTKLRSRADAATAGVLEAPNEAWIARRPWSSTPVVIAGAASETCAVIVTGGSRMAVTLSVAVVSMEFSRAMETSAARVAAASIRETATETSFAGAWRRTGAEREAEGSACGSNEKTASFPLREAGSDVDEKSSKASFDILCPTPIGRVVDETLPAAVVATRASDLGDGGGDVAVDADIRSSDHCAPPPSLEARASGAEPSTLDEMVCSLG
jgi:hypothetical protein